MKNLFISTLAVLSIFISSISFGATVSFDFDSLTAGTVTSATPVSLNSFTTLSTDGEIEIGSPLFGGSGLNILGFGSGDAIFSFDTSAVSVTSITLEGSSNNVPVIITTFDLGGLVQDSIQTDNSWSLPATLTNTSPISSINVRLLESEISNLSITYSAVPVPAAIWLFGSGLIALAGLFRLKNRRL